MIAGTRPDSVSIQFLDNPRLGRSAPGDQKVNANLIVKAPHKPSGVAGRATGAMSPTNFL